MSEPDSDTVVIEEGRVVHRSADQTYWSIAIDEIRVVGEYTIQMWPGGNDWFVVFVREDCTSVEAPMYGFSSEAVKRLGEAMGVELKSELYWCTDFNSRILYPPDGVGGPLFVFSDEQPTFFPRLREPLVRQVFSNLAMGLAERKP